MKKKLFLPALLTLLTLVLATCQHQEEQKLPAIDDFVGNCTHFELKEATQGLHQNTLVCRLKTETGSIIERNTTHTRLDGVSTFTMEDGLKDGSYRLLEFALDSIHNFGLGAMIEAKNGAITVSSKYDSGLELFGSGTYDDPFIITSSEHLLALANIANNSQSREIVKKGMWFKQAADIDARTISKIYNADYGWHGIGDDITRPFVGNYDGDGFKISGIWANRPVSVGVGLFGYVQGTIIKNVHLTNSSIKGNAAVGGIAGVALTSGAAKEVSSFYACKVDNTMINADSQDALCLDYGVGVGGILGISDAKAQSLIDSCEVGAGNIISGFHSVGGILGGSLVESESIISNCKNNGSRINAGKSAAGGIAGSGHYILIFTSENHGDVSGNLYQGQEQGRGIGGILGGSANSYVAGCTNTGNIKGQYGVGGIIGSSINIYGEDGSEGNGQQTIEYYDVLTQGCMNEGSIEGKEFVGGICGEAQLGASGCMNKGKVTAESQNAGGIIGGAPVGVIEYCTNIGNISGSTYCAGIAGRIEVGIMALSENYGLIKGNGSHVAGVVGLVGSNMMIHYCSNFNTITNKDANGLTAGIAAEVGNVREWTASDIASAVIGTVEVGLGALGAMITAAGYVAKFGKVLNLFCGAFSFFTGSATLISDTFFECFGIYSLAFEEAAGIPAVTAQNMEMAFDKISGQMSSQTKSAMDGITFVFPNNQGLRSSVIKNDYIANREKLVDFYLDESNDGSNHELFEYNMNFARDQFSTALANEARTEDIIHYAISGVTIAVSFVTIAVSAVATIAATAGTATPAALTIALGACGATVAIVGGANAISQSVDHFEQNASIVSQCLNMGNIDVPKDALAGGVVGVFQQSCKINDCFNGGNNIDSHARGGGIVGLVESNSIVHRNFNIGDNWQPYAICNQDPYTLYVDIQSNNYLNVTGDPSFGHHALSKDQLNDHNSYVGLDFSEDCLWSIPDESDHGYYAIPNKSEMQYENYSK